MAVDERATAVERSESPQVMCDAQAYWSQSATDRWRRDLSHWRGVGRWQEDAWLAVGDLNLALIREALQHCALQPSVLPGMNVLEWGCGGGANARVLCRECRHVWGVDISQPNLAECARQMRAFGHTNFTPVPIPIEQPEAAASCAAARGIAFDLVVSTAVFQRFPSRAYGARVLTTLRRVMCDGAFAFVQIRHNDGTAAHAPNTADYHRNAITFTSYTTREFTDLLRASRFEVLLRRIDIKPELQSYEYFFARAG